MKDSRQTKWLLIVTGKDRPGIIARVTGVLYDANCNLEDISMTILEGVFAMMVVVLVRNSKKMALDKALLRMRASTNLSIDWKKITSINSKANSKNLYLITAIGKDRTGIVYKISHELSRRRLNIQDLNSHVVGSKSKAVYAMALEVVIPQAQALSSLKRSLEALGRKLAVDITIKPVEQLEF